MSLKTAHVPQDPNEIPHRVRLLLAITFSLLSTLKPE
jgi:hypothetical protein